MDAIVLSDRIARSIRSVPSLLSKYAQSDAIDLLQEKMKAWIGNGVQLAWLLEPREEVTMVYMPNMEVIVERGFTSKLSGQGRVAGFELDLSLPKI